MKPSTTKDGGRLEHLVGRVWVYPSDPDQAAVQGGVVVIADDRGSVIVDAGHSPALGERVAAQVRVAGLPEPRWLVYTHHHWDHVWGATAWGEVEIIGHESGVALLAAERERPWSHAYLREQVAANPLLEPSFTARAAAMPNWDGFAIRLPHRTFATGLTLPIGVELRHVGGRHAPDSIIVVDRESSVAILGDCIYPPPWHLRTPSDGLDFDLAHQLLDEDHDWYVPSHAEPWRHTDAVPVLGLS